MPLRNEWCHLFVYGSGGTIACIREPVNLGQFSGIKILKYFPMQYFSQPLAGLSIRAKEPIHITEHTTKVIEIHLLHYVE